MWGLIEAEPLEERVAATLTALDDPREIAVGELVQGAAGLRTDVLHVHRFASAELRDRFYDWFWTDQNHAIGDVLVNVGYSSGTDAVSEILDGIATDPARFLKPARAKRGRRKLERA